MTRVIITAKGDKGAGKTTLLGIIERALDYYDVVAERQTGDHSIAFALPDRLADLVATRGSLQTFAAAFKR